MFSFDSKDFTKSALSLAAGMLLLIAVVGWRTQFDPYILITMAGFPLGVLSLWGVYVVKIRAAARYRSFQVNQRIRSSGVKPQHHYQRLTGKMERRTLGKLNEMQKNRILGGRPLEFSNSEGAEEIDQWHRG